MSSALEPNRHLSDVEIDALVDAMLAHAAAAGMTFEEWVEREYRAACPWWLRAWHRLGRRSR